MLAMSTAVAYLLLLLLQCFAAHRAQKCSEYVTRVQCSAFACLAAMCVGESIGVTCSAWCPCSSQCSFLASSPACTVQQSSLAAVIGCNVMLPLCFAGAGGMQHKFDIYCAQ